MSIFSHQVEWQQKGGTYWVRYVHVEIIGFVNPGTAKNSKSANIGVGDRVRVKAQIATPKYKWGSVTHRSVGVVIGRRFEIDFLLAKLTVID
jgi:E3 ubiquitin-protein ligase HERC2